MGILIAAMTILAHFDGKVIVPDELVNIPADALLEVDIRSRAGASPSCKTAAASRLAALERVVARARHGLRIPAEALRREQLYGDDGR